MTWRYRSEMGDDCGWSSEGPVTARVLMTGRLEGHREEVTEAEVGGCRPPGQGLWPASRSSKKKQILLLESPQKGDSLVTAQFVPARPLLDIQNCEVIDVLFEAIGYVVTCYSSPRKPHSTPPSRSSTWIGGGGAPATRPR